MNRVILSPEYFGSPTIGRPISNADIYVGEPDTDPEVVINQKQISVQQEDGSIIPVSQPISTGVGGYPTYNGSTVTILVDGDYSLKVLDNGGGQDYYIPSVAYPLPLNIEKLTDYASLAAAVAAIGATEAELWIDTDDTLTGNVTTPETLNLRFINGNVVDTDSYTLTIHSPENVLAGEKQQIVTTTGTLAFTEIGSAPIGWTGGVADGDGAGGGTDNATAINKLVAALPFGSTLVFPGGIVQVASVITITKRLNIIGNTTVIHNTGAGHGIFYDGDGGLIDRIHVRDLYIVGEAGTQDGLRLNNVNKSRFTNVLTPKTGEAGLHLTSRCILNTFVGCGTNVNNMAGLGIVTSAAPKYGLLLDDVDEPAPSASDNNANSFIGWTSAGVVTAPGVGIDIQKGDINTFVGGSSEGNTIGVRHATGEYNSYYGAFTELNNSTDYSGAATDRNYLGQSFTIDRFGRGILAVDLSDNVIMRLDYKDGIMDTPLQPSVRAYPASEQVLTTDTLTLVDFATEAWDTQGEWATNRFTATNAGKYSVLAQVLLKSWVDGTRMQMYVYVDGALDTKADTYLTTANTQTYSISTTVDLAAAGFIEIRVRQVTGGDVSIDDIASQSFVTINKIA